MTTKKVVDEVSAPVNYEALFLQYWDYTVRFVQKVCGVEQGDAEDVASEILATIYQRDALGLFNPDYGGVGQARFKSWLNVWVARYGRGKEERLRIKRTREQLLCDAPVGESGVWVEVFGTPTSDFAPEVEERVDADLSARYLIEDVRYRLGKEPVVGKRDLLRVFDLMAVQVCDEGADRASRLRIAQEMGVSETVIGTWIGMIRTIIHDVAAEAHLDGLRPAIRAVVWDAAA
jgi:DNA-directed RNA polymerase specialized sigma24 family protein